MSLGDVVLGQVKADSNGGHDAMVGKPALPPAPPSCHKEAVTILSSTYSKHETGHSISPPPYKGGGLFNHMPFNGGGAESKENAYASIGDGGKAWFTIGIGIDGEFDGKLVVKQSFQF